MVLPNSEDSLSLEEQFWAANAMTQFARLAALDQVWTDYLQSAGRDIPDQDIEVLERLTGEMDLLLQEAPDRAGFLDHLVAEHAGELEQRYERVLESDELTEDDRSRLREAVDRRDGIVPYARSSMDGILNEAHVESETLSAKMEVIRGGGFAPGDLGSQFLCNLAGGCILTGLFAPPPTNMVGVGVGITILVGVYMRGDECL